MDSLISREQNLMRAQLLTISQELMKLGLNRGTSGNCSVRFGEGFLITPSGVGINDLSVESMVLMNLDGSVNQTSGVPSSEWRFHRDIYLARPEIAAVIHTHSTYATTLACLRKEIPAVHYMIAVAGGSNIRCSDYALFGSQELSDTVLTALENRKACLMANHGMISVGKELKEALAIAVEVESLSEMYLKALTVGNPVILNDLEMIEVVNKFKNYGSWSEDDE